MEAFYEYIVAAFTVSLVVGICERITPSALKKHVTFVSSLILLIFLFTPITALGEELFHFADSVIDNELPITPSNSAYDEMLTLARKTTETAIQKHLNETFNLQDHVSVSLTMEMQENGTILLTGILLNLDSNDRQIAEEIEAYLEEEFHTETKIIISTEE